MEPPLQDVLVNYEGIIVCEGVDTGDHLVDQDTQSPPVDRFSVSLVLKNLRSEVFGGTAEGESPVFDHFCESEVGEFEVAIWANEYVFRLEVAIDDVLGVEILEYLDNLCGVESKCRAVYAAL